METQATYAVESERKRNQEAYERLRGELDRKYQGRFVLIADGKLIADGPTFEEVAKKGDEVVPKASHRIVFKVGEVYPKEVTIGSSDVPL